MQDSIKNLTVFDEKDQNSQKLRVYGHFGPKKKNIDQTITFEKVHRQFGPITLNFII